MGMCVECHDREATLRCRQCGKAVCPNCAQKDANGAFCSRECSANYRGYLDKTENAPKPKKSGPGLITKLVGVLIIIALVVVALYKLGVIGKDDLDKAREKAAGAAKEAVEAGKDAAEKGKKAIEDAAD